MLRGLYPSLLVLMLACLLPGFSAAQDGVLSKDDGPPISITSPDAGSTYVYATLKTRSLFWNKHDHVLVARVTFVEADAAGDGTPQDDTEDFRLPGIAFDEARGIFSATTAKGEVIPVAHLKKALFGKTIEILPNAHVRVIRNHGAVTVIIEAISPNDPAMRSVPANPDGQQTVNIRQILGP